LRSFWDGFYKQAGVGGNMKGLVSGLRVGAKPRPLVSVAAAFKPNKIPTPNLHAAPNKNMTATLVKSQGDVTPKHPSGKGLVGDMSI
jgi:hypothetical protein